MGGSYFKVVKLLPEFGVHNTPRDLLALFYGPFPDFRSPGGPPLRGVPPEAGPLGCQTQREGEEKGPGRECGFHAASKSASIFAGVKNGKDFCFGYAN